MQVLKLNERTARELLESDETFAFTLMTILLSKYGEETFTEKPPALFQRLEDDFGIKLPEESENRINAALTVMMTDLFQTNFSVFKSVTLALNEGDIGDFAIDFYGEREELSTPEILWAITEYGLLTGLNFKDAEDSLSPELIDKLNEIIDDEAEDTEDADNDTDTVSEAFTEPYYQKYVTVNLLELARQLLSLGVENSIVSDLLKEFNRSMEELKQENAE